MCAIRRKINVKTRPVPVNASSAVALERLASDSLTQLWQFSCTYSTVPRSRQPFISSTESSPSVPVLRYSTRSDSSGHRHEPTVALCVNPATCSFGLETDFSPSLRRPPPALQFCLHVPLPVALPCESFRSACLSLRLLLLLAAATRCVAPPLRSFIWSMKLRTKVRGAATNSPSFRCVRVCHSQNSRAFSRCRFNMSSSTPGTQGSSPNV